MENIISSERPKSTVKSISIVIAENGTVSDHNVSKFLPQLGVKKGASLMDYIQKEYGVERDQQVILRAEDGKQLDANTLLDEYFEKERVIYVYNKVFYKKEQITDDFEVIGPISLERSSKTPHFIYYLEISDSAKHQLLIMYEDYFGGNLKETMEGDNLYKFEEMVAYFGETRNESSAIREGTIKLTRQKDSEQVAKRNLLNYYTEKKKMFDETIQGLEKKMNCFRDQLKDFDGNIANLSNTEISNVLQDEERKHLIDYFDVNKIKQSKLTYDNNQSKISQKITEIKSEIEEYDKKLISMNENMNEETIDLQNRLAGLELDLLHVQDSSLQELKALIEQSSRRPTALEVNEFVKKEWNTVMPKLRTIGQTLDKIREEIERKLKDNANHLKTFISDIATLQQGIRSKLSNKLTIVGNLVEKHKQDMFNIDIIEKFATVYDRSLDEIERRRIFRLDYALVLNLLEKMVNDENDYRKEFLTAFQQYLPKTFCPFLSKTFTQLKFENIKKNLELDVGIETVETSPKKQKPVDNNDIFSILTKIENRTKSSEDRIKELERILKQKTEENIRLKEERLTAQSVRLLFGKIDFDESLEKLVVESKKSIEQKFTKLNQRIKSFEEVKSKIQTSIKLASNKVSQAEVDKLKQTYNAQKAELEQKYSLLKAQVEQVQQSSEESKQAEQALRSRIIELEAELRTKENLMSGKDHEIQQKSDEVLALSRQMEREKELFANENKKSSQKFAELRNERDQAVKGKETAEDQLRNEQMEKGGLLSKLEMLSKLEPQAKELSVSVANLNSEKEKIAKELNEKINQLESRKNEAEKTVANLKISLSEAKNEAQENRSKFEGQLEEGKKKLDDYNKLVTQIETLAADKKNIIAGIQLNLEKEKEEKQRLQQKVNELQKQIDSQKNLPNENLSLELSTISFEKDKLRKELDNEKSKNYELENVLNKSLIVNDNSKELESIIQYFGENVLDMYTRFVPGKKDVLNQRETDVKEMLIEVQDVIESEFVKLKNFHNGDNIVAVKVSDLDRVYQIINTEEYGGSKVFYFFRSPEKRGNLIFGALKEMKAAQEVLDKRFNDCTIVEAVLVNVHDILSANN